MAIGWLAILKTVPWSDVISNAPMVADGAKKLWTAVAGKRNARGNHTEGTQPLSPEAQALADTDFRIAELESAVSELRTQMLASSELIQALADQNAQLIKSVETNRIRGNFLMIAIIVATIVAFFSLAMVFMR
jgi:hypothetical protein